MAKQDFALVVTVFPSCACSQKAAETLPTFITDVGADFEKFRHDDVSHTGLLISFLLMTNLNRASSQNQLNP